MSKDEADEPLGDSAPMGDVADLVGSRADDDPGLSEQAKLLIVAALEGDATLASVTGGAECRPPSRDDMTPVEPAGAFVHRITVRGFRGIGPQARLELKPGAGLTVVAGRNGSGKSSFAEALEVALTGTTYRWHNKAKQWRNVWRNLHYPDAPRIDVTLAEEGVGQTDITVEWPDDADLDGLVTSLQRKGEKKQAGIASLGWTAPLEIYRPMLTYDELGGLLEAAPSKLYDALSTILGLEQITDAIGRLTELGKRLDAPRNRLAERKKSLQRELGEVDDERAVRARKLIAASTPDVAALRSLATGSTTDETTSRLREIRGLALPGPDAVAPAVMRLRDAVSDLAGAGNAASETLERHTALLDAAVRVHEHEGDTTCPVCGDGWLDTARTGELRQAIVRANERLDRLRRARTEIAEARHAAKALVLPLPPVLNEPLPGALEPTRSRLVEAWTTKLPDDDLALADRLGAWHRASGDTLAELRTAAETELTERDAAWTGVAAHLAGYADDAEAWLATKPDADAAKAALTWLKSHDTELKNERLRPISQQAAEIWADLRQESNVEIADLTLAGAATRRHVEIAASVDGEDAGGLAVLSQGELHALALALFLPRATMEQSPFRFVILDDPVQAMDPAKVDGLVTVLSRIAKDRQVVVFSHDDRLADAVRRAAVDATILEVVREAGSKVTVNDNLDPARRYLYDAFAMVMDKGLPDSTLRRLLPGMLRFAVESAARDRYVTNGLARGTGLIALEKAWQWQHTTAQRVSLAIYETDKDLGPWLTKATHRKRALGICTSGMHRGVYGKPYDACLDVQKLLGDIKAGAK